jgi:hypothetical protein
MEEKEKSGKQSYEVILKKKATDNSHWKMQIINRFFISIFF